MKILGIDIGFTGAIAAIDPADFSLSLLDVPIRDGSLDIIALRETLLRLSGRYAPQSEAFAVLEKVHAFRGQGISSTSKFMELSGIYQGMLTGLDIAYYRIDPRTWRNRLVGQGTDKESSRKLAREMWPNMEGFERVKDHNRAEAALLAYYGYRFILPGLKPDRQ